MQNNIRPMTIEDKADVLDMMRVFYSSEAVLSNGSEEIFLNDIENCIGDNPYLEGYVFERGKICIRIFILANLKLLHIL